MENYISTKWVDDMSFESEINGFKIVVDAHESVGGKNKGPRPKPFMLSALGGCTGMDVVSILRKMRVVADIENFEVKVGGELTENHPKQYKNMHVIYEFKAKSGKTLPEDKIEKAVKMSQESYCGVIALYKKAIDVTFEIVVN